MNEEFKLITIEKPKTSESIRDHYYRLQEYNNNIGLGIAQEKGSIFVRKYYNDINLRKRKKL